MRILLIEDNPRHARLLEDALGQAGVAFAGAPPYDLVHVVRLDAGFEYLSQGGIDVTLVDLSLPEATGLDALLRLREHSPGAALVALVSHGEDTLAGQALQTGAQDYLVKDRLSGDLLARTIRGAIRVNRLQNALRTLSLMDGLTSLYNRRGFETLGEGSLRLAQRAKGHFLVVSADVENLKGINEAGWEVGDVALRDCAEILRRTFRESDIIARMENSAFAVLAVDASPDTVPIMTRRLQREVDAYNGQTLRRYTLVVNLGFAAFSGGEPASVEELLARAVQARRLDRRGRRPSRRSQPE
ncbi:MAG: GGDEF domain-containing protein [Burkholderiales bacterium]